MANAHTFKLPLKKETKNMLQYQVPDEDKRDAPVPTLYVAKSLFSDNDWPPILKVTVEGVSK